VKPFQAPIKGGVQRVLVFCLYKKEAARIHKILTNAGYRTACIHGDMQQHERTKSIKRFKDGSFPILVATDVAALNHKP